MSRLIAHFRRAFFWLRRQDWLRSGLLFLCCCGALGYYLLHVHAIYPIQDWLFVPLVQVWAWSALLHLACWGAGLALGSKVLHLDDLPVAERTVQAVAIGFSLFAVSMYLLGALALYRTPATIALTALMLGLGAKALHREYVSFKQSAQELRRALHPFMYVAMGLAACALGILYIQTLTPEALNYDARWYHLTVGEDYAREGRLVPFYADYNKAAFPHFTALLYTWCSLLPGMDTPLSAIWILQNEFFFFVWTLLAIHAAVRWMLRDRPAPGAWMVFCLFPGVFIYDNNLGGSADHFLGFFAIPIFLAAARALPAFDPRACAALGIVVGGATLVKYQSIYVGTGVALALGARLVWVTARRRQQVGKNLWLGPLMAALLALMVSLPHFAKSWVFYRNPLYPYLVDWFPASTPLQPDAALGIQYMWLTPELRPPADWVDRLAQAVELVFQFSFEPHASVGRASIGPLFSLMLPALVFIRDRRRIMLGAWVGAVGIVVWASTYVVDRYLQTLVPLLMAVTAALIIRVFDSGRAARAGVVALVGFQLVWGADGYFYSGYSHISDALALIRSGFEGKASRRFDKYLADARHLDRTLPKDAVLLFHNTRLSLGIQRKVYQDLPGYQSLISYRDVKNVHDLVRLYRSFGITHVVHERGKWKALTRQEEVVFAMFVARHKGKRWARGGFEVLALPEKLPDPEPTYQVLCLGLPGYADGMYLVDQLRTMEPLPAHVKEYARPQTAVGEAPSKKILAVADAVLIGHGYKLAAAPQASLHRRFSRVFHFTHQLDVYVANNSP